MLTNNIIARWGAAGSDRWNALAGLAFVAASPVVTWFVLGDQSSPGFRPEELDYEMRAPEFSPGVNAAAFIGASVALVVATVVLGLALPGVPKHRRRRWIRLIGAFAGAGALVGCVGRVMTAGGIGANIGAGMMIMTAPFVLLFFAVIAAQAGWALRGNRPAMPRGINSRETRW